MKMNVKMRCTALGTASNMYKTDNPRRYKPLSYYVLGGTDIDGSVSKDLNSEVPVAYDGDDAIAEMSKKGKIESIGVADPRVDMFDLVESANSVKSAQHVIDNATPAPGDAE